MASLATVVVLRRHVNGNITGGVYMVDLLCLGVKDSWYFFNEPPEDIEERLDFADNKLWQKIDYALAHNIVYAGHDFAAEFHIEPHKLFALTKYILQEDDDTVPLIEIKTGDEEGRPHLMGKASGSYGPVLAKLKKYAGEGNYIFTIEDESMDWENEDDEDIDEEDDDENEEEEGALSEIEEGYLDFDDVSALSTSQLVGALRNDERLLSEEIIIKAELLFRYYDEKRGETVAVNDDNFQHAAYEMYDKRQDKWTRAFKKSQSSLGKILEEAQALGLSDKDDETEIYLSLADKYSKMKLLSVHCCKPAHP